MAARTKANHKCDVDREIRELTLPQAWAIVMRAWRNRRRVPTEWQLIANNITLVGHWQERE
jgi:hypothetical protein